MCEKCVEAVRKYFPNLSQEDYGELLMGATCFPFGPPEMVEAQLKELQEKTDGSLLGALAFADAELIKAMEAP